MVWCDVITAYNWSIGRQLLKLGLVFVGMVTLNNLCLQYVEVSFYNVARSLTIVFNVIFTLAILRQPTSLPVCGTLVIVVAGFFVGSDGGTVLHTAYCILHTAYCILSGPSN